MNLCKIHHSITITYSNKRAQSPEVCLTIETARKRILWQYHFSDTETRNAHHRARHPLSIAMKNLFISFFVLTSLSLIFSDSWNMLAETMLSKWEIKDADGNVKKPLLQNLVYALSVTVFSILVLYILTHPKLKLIGEE